jgi:hypothetical protein
LQAGGENVIFDETFVPLNKNSDGSQLMQQELHEQTQKMSQQQQQLEATRVQQNPNSRQAPDECTRIQDIAPKTDRELTEQVSCT